MIQQTKEVKTATVKAVVRIHRPQLSERERQKKEKEIMHALRLYGVARAEAERSAG